MTAELTMRAYYRVTECGAQTPPRVAQLSSIVSSTRCNVLADAIATKASRGDAWFFVLNAAGQRFVFEPVTDNATLLSPGVDAALVADEETGDYWCIDTNGGTDFIGPIVYYVVRDTGDGLNRLELAQCVRLMNEAGCIAGPLASLAAARTALWQYLTGSTDDAPDTFARWISNEGER